MLRNSKRRPRLFGAMLSAALIALSATSLAQTPKVGLELVAEGLTSPTMLVPAPDGSSRLFVLDQVGVI